MNMKSVVAIILVLGLWADAEEYSYPTYTLQAATDGKNLIQNEDVDPMFPTVVKIPAWVPAEKRLDPQARYYLYWTQHIGDSVFIRWASSLENMTSETWKQHPQSVLSVATDSKRKDWDYTGAATVLINDEAKLFYLFFQGKSSPSTINGARHSGFLATSPWGLNFNDPLSGGGEPGTRLDGEPFGIVEHKGYPSGTDAPAEFGSYYTRVFTHRNRLYAIGKRAQLYRAPRDDPQTPLNEAFAIWTLGNQWEAWPEPARTPPRPLPGKHYDEYSKASPVTLFIGSTEFANHKNNPHPSHTVNSRGRKRLKHRGGGWVNHVDIEKITETQFEIFFYLKTKKKPSKTAMYTGIYRVVLNTADPDWTQWDLLRDNTGEVIFETVLSQHQGFSEDLPLGDPHIFRDNGHNYLFYSYGPEGHIGAVKLIPNH